MTPTLVFSVMRHSEDGQEALQKTLDAAASEMGLKFSYLIIDYEFGRKEFTESVIHGDRLDVSEIGTTWINDFITKEALIPFSPDELSVLGVCEDAYPPCLWESSVSAAGEVYAIPWMTDLSLVYYRRDMLRAARVKETGAFSTPERFEETLYRLSRIDVPTPWVVPTRRSYITVHNLAMWLWAHGVDYLDKDRRRFVITEPSARPALREYFGLSRYMGESAQRLAERQADNMFISGEAAATISGPWLYPECQRRFLDFGLAIPFGQSFIGGSSLVVWKSGNTGSRSRSRAVLKQSALKLVDALAGSQMFAYLPGAIGMLPARLALLRSSSNIRNCRHNRLIAKALKTGRSLQQVRLWGILEHSLAESFECLWAGLLPTSAADIDLLIDQQLVPEVNKLNSMLENLSA